MQENEQTVSNPNPVRGFTCISFGLNHAILSL